MRTLARRALKAPTSGEPLPWNFPQFERREIRPMRGTVTIVAATPASGKTFLVTKWVKEINEPTLYFSADTDADTMLARSAAIATGNAQVDIRQALIQDEGGREFYSAHLAEAFGHTRWVWESDPTYEDISLETMAFTEAFGDFPKVIVIDNLMNVVGEKEDESASLKDHTKALHKLAYITGAAVIALHHMREDSTTPDVPAPLRHVAGKVSQLIGVVISLTAAETPQGDVIRACAVKNRWGKHDKTGRSYVEVPVDLERGLFFRDEPSRNAGLPL